MKNKFLLTIIVIIFPLFSFSQNSRINDQNTIGWYIFFGTYKLSNKIGLHTEYQWRRNNVITDWQQSLLRLGVNYQLNPRVLLRVGYAWIETFPYGEYSINSMNRDFTEHRTFQMVQLSHKESIVDISHRFMLEQRFIGSYSAASISNEDEYKLLNRMRYMFRLQLPLKGKEISDKTPYAAFYNEVFIGFGKNVNANVFDQNRIGLLLGYRFNQHIRIEGGYLNHIVQFGRLINSQNVFQYNNGLIINALVNIN
jgi:opacity protein-like surface antigen